MTDVSALIAEARAQASEPMIGKSQWRELDKAILMIRRLADALEEATLDRDAAEAKADGYRANNARMADTLDAIRAVLADAPEPCPEHPDGDPITCGWKSDMIRVRRILNGGDSDAGK